MDRKRITKTTYCKETSYEHAVGEGGFFSGKIYAIQFLISHCCTALVG
jgi:hypothetical protein